MKDTIIKNAGNSRFLRSSVAEDITFAEFIALLRAGQLPIDLAGINEEGIDTLGMPLGKSTLLDDETETAIWGSPGDRKPTEALKTIFETLSARVSEKANVVTGTYTGNGAASRTISLGFKPSMLFLTGVIVDYGIPDIARDGGDPVYMATVTPNYPFKFTYSGETIKVAELVSDGFAVHRGDSISGSGGDWYSNTNTKNKVYSYIAIA